MMRISFILKCNQNMRFPVIVKSHQTLSKEDLRKMFDLFHKYDVIP